jgi:hypothetical protein
MKQNNPKVPDNPKPSVIEEQLQTISKNSIDFLSNDIDIGKTKFKKIYF